MLHHTALDVCHAPCAEHGALHSLALSRRSAITRERIRILAIRLPLHRAIKRKRMNIQMPSSRNEFVGYQIILTAPKQVQIREYAEPPLPPNEVRLQTLYSGISAGTELTQYRGTNPYLNKRWDAERRMFLPGENPTAYPVTNWGYEEVGQVVEVGDAVKRVQPSDRIWGSWGHKSTHIVTEDWAAARLLDSALDPLCGIFSHVGAIALNVILDAEIHLGEFVAIFGQGVMGLVVTQLARLHGGTVIAVDGIARRLELARAGGADYTINFHQQEPAETIKQLTHGRGADVSIEITGSYDALHTAIRATAYNSKVIAAGFYQGEGRGLELGDEFHHNRIQIVSSQISGSNPRLQHRWERLRLNQTVMQLQAQKRLNLLPLVTHHFAARDAAAAFALLDTDSLDAVQVVLDFAKPDPVHSHFGVE